MFFSCVPFCLRSLGRFENCGLCSRRLYVDMIVFAALFYVVSVVLGSSHKVKFQRAFPGSISVSTKLTQYGSTKLKFRTLIR